MKKICYVATVPDVVHAFLRGFIQAGAETYTIKLISNPRNSELLKDLPTEFHALDIQRKISAFSDAFILIQLIFYFRRERFDLVHSIMPKTGLLTMLAAFIAGVPNRLHTFTGQVWATKQGWKRSLLKLFDKLIVFCATHVLVDSPSQRDFLIKEGVLSKGKAVVIGHGSICGVDSSRFFADAEVKKEVRTELAISAEQTVLLFLGRLNRDKGIVELAHAFAGIADLYEDVILVLVGAEEDVPFTRVQEICVKHCEKLRRVTFTPTPERYMAAADIFCLPSFREGFGQVIIEAAASSVPTVATRIYGVTDAVEEGKTGLLVPAGDVNALAEALLALIEDKKLREQMGLAAKQRALELFSSERITQAMLEFYKELLS